jgi:hypothetical protein
LKDREDERHLCLDEEEAIGLLNIVMFSPTELNAEQRAAVLKLSDYCRQFLREPAESSSVITLNTIPVHAAPYAA